MIHCIALDDEPLALSLIKDFSRKIPYLSLSDTFTQPSKAKIFLKNNPCDLLFLDIQMPDVSGINFLKTLSNDIMVIFTTAYTEYAVEGFELNAIDYLLKPFNLERFTQAVEKAKEYHTFIRSRNEGEYIFVYSEYNLLKINLADIDYIEGLGDYIKIVTANNKPILSLMTMKGVLEKLPESQFVRVHRSFIIPVAKFQGIRGKNILLTNNHMIPMGDTYKEGVDKILH